MAVATSGASATRSSTGLDLTGYEVEATDGPIGTIDMATHDVGASYIVVDTGIWKARGSRVVLPAGDDRAATAPPGSSSTARARRSRTRRRSTARAASTRRERAMLDSYYRAGFYAQEPWEARLRTSRPSAPARSCTRRPQTLGVAGRSKMTSRSSSARSPPRGTR